MKIQNCQQIQEALLKKGWSMRGWALSHNYHPRTVAYCIQIFAPSTGRTAKRPHAKAIMQSLSETLNTDLMGVSDE